VVQVILLRNKWLGIGIESLLGGGGEGAHTPQVWLITVKKKRPKAFISS
jgi:hypothetical protein